MITTAHLYTRSEAEHSHARSSNGTEYGPETVITLPDGRALHCPAHPEECSYVRIVHDGDEITYWSSDEWREAPAEVMGAILGVLRAAQTLGPATPATATVVDDEFMVCEECLGFIANDDLTSLDFHYSKKESDRREREIRAGVAQAGGDICSGDSKKNQEFSQSACKCCGSTLAGPRHHCVLMKPIVANSLPMERDALRAALFGEFSSPEEFHISNAGWVSTLAEAYESEHDWKKDDDPSATHEMLAHARQLVDGARAIQTAQAQTHSKPQ